MHSRVFTEPQSHRAMRFPQRTSVTKWCVTAVAPASSQGRCKDQLCEGICVKCCARVRCVKYEISEGPMRFVSPSQPSLPSLPRPGMPHIPEFAPAGGSRQVPCLFLLLDESWPSDHRAKLFVHFAVPCKAHCQTSGVKKWTKKLSQDNSPNGG